MAPSRVGEPNILEHAEALISGLGASASMQSLLTYPIRKAEAQLALNDRWPVLFLPLTLGRAYGLREEITTGLGLASLLLYGFADLTDDAQDGDLPETWSWQRAVNAGNALAFLGSEVLLRLALPSSAKESLCRAYAQAGRNMTFGQESDLLATFPEVPTVATYLDTVSGKTGASVAFFAKASAIAAQETEGTVSDWHEVGESLGIYHQIISDLQASLESDSSDLRNRKITLPLIFGLTQTDSGDDIVRILQGSENRGELAEQLRRIGAVSYCRMRAETCRRRGLKTLKRLNLSQEVEEAIRNLFDTRSSHPHIEL